MHLPPNVSTPLAQVHTCAPELLQSHSCTFVPLAVEAPLASTHLPARPEVMGPTCGGVTVPGVSAKLSNWSVWYPVTPSPAWPVVNDASVAEPTVAPSMTAVSVDPCIFSATVCQVFSPGA